MFWKEFVALLVAFSFSVKGWKFVTLAVPGGSPTGPPRAVLVEALAPVPKPKPPVVFVVVELPPNMVLPVVAAPKAGLDAPKRLLVPVEAPPKGLEVEAAVLLLLPKPPPKPPPEVVVVAPPNRLLLPVVVDAAPKAGFAPKALLLLVDPKARKTCVSKPGEVAGNRYD